MVVPLLPQAPVLAASMVAELLGVSDRAARNALEILRLRNVVDEVAVERNTGGRPAAPFAATKLLDAMAGWGR